VAPAAVEARLTGTRVMTVAHVDARQRLLQQLHPPLVDHHLHAGRPTGRHGNNINYTVSQENDADVAHYNFNAHQPILVIFGADVAE